MLVSDMMKFHMLQSLLNIMIKKQIEFFTSEQLREIIKFYEQDYYVIGYRAKDQENTAVLYLVKK